MYGDSVIPFYSYDEDKKKYLSVGSAVLLEHRSRKFLITAAHVLEDLAGEKTYMFFANTFFRIRNLPAYLSDCSKYGNRNNDPFDLAAIPLPEELVEICDPCWFVRIDQYVAGASVESSLYQALGYAYAKNTKAANKTARIPGGFRAEGVRYTVTDVGGQAFPYKSFCSSYHIATCLTKTAVTQGARKNTNVPDLHGVSGGLLQKVVRYNQSTDGFDEAYPSGIVLEKKRDNSAFYSLRLGAVFEWLDIHWDKLLGLRSLSECV